MVWCYKPLKFLDMKKRLLFLAAIFSATLLSAQPMVKNLSTGFSVELTQGRHQMILLPTETKSIWFLPLSGEAKEIKLRYFVGNNVKSVVKTDLKIVGGQVVELPLQPVEETKVSSGVSSSSNTGSLPEFTPKIPEVSGNLKVESFPLILIDSTDVSILVFEGDFYGASLTTNQQTEPIITGPGIISMKIIYDPNNTGKNLWQIPIQGIITQGQKYFVIKRDHIKNVQRDITRVVFYNSTPYSMVPDGLDIDPIPPHHRSRAIKLNQGFNNLSFTYLNSQGVKVRAVFETVITRGTPVVSLNPNPLGNAYGIIK